MLDNIISFSLKNKLIILLFVTGIVAFGTYSLWNIPIGAVPDVTNNQVQVITTSRNLSTQDIEQFITYPVELEMANLPGVREIRSISKFGLSVVTVVFDDDMGTYLPRQLIAEKIKSAAENIPDEFGTPEMGPITTGLGEIYQYVLEVDPAYRNRYSVMELRTIQDWIVKRQLSGIPGVVEVNTWGGYLKQFEVRVHPEKLRARNLTIHQVFDAIAANNSVVGGGYIEKSDQAYFIRGEGLTKTIADIQNIAVVQRNQLPVYIRDVAEVGFGHANRFGAITGNGEGEKVLGQVMMLKNADSRTVILAVKDRVEQIQKSLPPGVSINPFLERSELINKTTFTITENLVLGCLIVVFVVIILLGDLRTGLVVASIIPLSLLFALSLMYVFGVDANLMSLGAIDFGIIIDGTVIIVEYIAVMVTARQADLLQSDRVAQHHLMDQITGESASKMMHSAIFGQLIIIIVFIPILSLGGIEGKMFRPMALTFCFALIGAILLCFTYVPVIASLFIRPAAPYTFSVRLIDWVRSIYQPTLTWALSKVRVVLSIAVLVMAGAVLLFSRLGGEFVPTLDEGDFVIQPIIKTGTSLSKTIDITTQIETIIQRFPEVDQVVTRIGAAEVPTDPMSMEETDVIITLLPKSEWQTAKSKDELANAIKDALVKEIPGVDYEFTQPIEMRFNELITGVRADLAIKVFGEDLNALVKVGEEIEALIQDVPGASDISVEKIDGLPQMSVVYNREQIARYGLNVADVNDFILMGFAGKSAGSVFEGERRFDLVVRFEKGSRTDIRDLKNTYVSVADDTQVPLSELAAISYTKGPAQISRDDTKRRIVVSVNVRDRDLESVVNDIESLINQHIQLPPGYLVTYGGQFENLRNARERLMYAVPVALMLIFIMLFFAFRSIKDALMVYSAIPLASVGGVLFLWLRELPFSISAGVGFIALFGIAVLNGIVLVEYFKDLKVKDFPDLKALVVKGATQRLRPVLLTASAAAMGFLPMAVSTSAGAEVQRPLATVVIGGLITATLLTLVVLPSLYYLVNRRKRIPTNMKMLVIPLIFLAGTLNAQTEPFSLDNAIKQAIQANPEAQAARLEVERMRTLMGSAYDFEKATIYYNYDQNNIAPNGLPLRVWGIQQSIAFPTVYTSQRKRFLQRIDQSRYELALIERRLTKEVALVYYNLQYLNQYQLHFQRLDSTYQRFYRASSRRLELGETNLLEKLTAEAALSNIQQELTEITRSIEQDLLQLQQLLFLDDPVFITYVPLVKLSIDSLSVIQEPGVSVQQSKVAQLEADGKVRKQQLLPDLQLEFFRGTNSAVDARIYNGFQVGLSVPLLFGAQRAEIKALNVERSKVNLYAMSYQSALQSKKLQLGLELEKLASKLDRYEQTGQRVTQELMRVANRSYESGEIDFLQYIQTLERAIELEVNYLSDLNNYNQTIIELNYLTLE